MPLTPPLTSLAPQETSKSIFSQASWNAVLESAQQSLKSVNTDLLVTLLTASQSPRQFTLVIRLMYQYEKSHRHGEPITDIILRNANESAFALSDWLSAIEFFHDWLEEKNRKMDFLSMLNYLSCCVESPDARYAGQTLTPLLKDMLQIFGYDG